MYTNTLLLLRFFQLEVERSIIKASFTFVRAKYSNFFSSYVHFHLLDFLALYVQLLHALNQKIPVMEDKKTVNFHFIFLFI